MEATVSTVTLVTKFIIEDILSTSDSEDSDEEIIITMELLKRNKKNTLTHVRNYVENVVWLYSDVEFKNHFRLNRTTFMFLLELLTPQLSRQSNRYGRYPYSPEKQLLAAIWMFATPNSYRCISDRFSMSKSTAWTCVRRVVNALYVHRHAFIKWPSQEEACHIWTSIEERHRFPKVIGAIDGTHIRIAAPKDYPEAYVNRKGYHSMQLQVVCDSTLKFTHCYCGQAGSVHDMRVFKLSGFDNMFTADNFPQNSHILGDAAYSLNKYIIVPFKDNGHLMEEQINYNKCHSGARMMIERSLGLLKGRFRSILDKLPMTRTDLIPKYVVACCILHNICIIKNDIIEIPLIANERPVIPQIRETISLAERNEGIAKRNAIAYSLMYD